jgi:Bacterial protein of unknown function (DUF839)
MKISIRSAPHLLPLALLTLGPVGAAVAVEIQGPSSSQTPYVVATAPGVIVKSIMTVGDSANLKPDGVTPYRMVGIADGLGAFKDRGARFAGDDKDDDEDKRSGKDGDDDEDGDDHDHDHGRGGAFNLLMNHEIGGSLTNGLTGPLGVLRAHGNAGAFVSLWTIRKKDLSVEKVEDLIPNGSSIYLSDNWPSSGVGHTGYLPGSTTVISRLCSADLAPTSAYFYRDRKGKTFGTRARIFQSGEESGGIARGFAPGFTGNFGNESEIHFGRQFAFIATDDPRIPGDQARTAYELPHAGIFPWENNLANPKSQLKTIVMGMDDATPGQIYVWVGEKQATGNVVERAGLTRKSARDNLYVIKVNGLTPDSTGATNESRDVALSGEFSLENEGDVSALTGPQLEALSDSKGGTQFLRPEDGQWDPKNPSDFYFVTTDRYDQVKDGVGTQVGRSRLYRLRFTDISQPELGGSIEALLDGTEAGNMFDNMTVTNDGRVLIQEDAGNQQRLGRIWLYDIETDALTEIARHDPARFGDIGVPALAPFNQDEESSGIIDASKFLGKGWYLFDVQAHYSIPGELVEGGQLLALYVPPKQKKHR